MSNLPFHGFTTRVNLSKNSDDADKPTRRPGCSLQPDNTETQGQDSEGSSAAGNHRKLSSIKDQDPAGSLQPGTSLLLYPAWLR